MSGAMRVLLRSIWRGVPCSYWRRSVSTGEWRSLTSWSFSSRWAEAWVMAPGIYSRAHRRVGISPERPRLPFACWQASDCSPGCSGKTAAEKALMIRVGIGPATQRGRFRRPVLVFFLGFLDGLVRRNDPIETVLLFHLGQDERLFAGDERQRRAQEIGSVGGDCFLRLAFVHGV